MKRNIPIERFQEHPPQEATKMPPLRGLNIVGAYFYKDVAPTALGAAAAWAGSGEWRMANGVGLPEAESAGLIPLSLDVITLPVRF